LTSRDAALGALAGLRDRVYRALACRARPYSANALSTVVHDVDAVQDLFVRCVVPFAGAVLVSAASTAVVWWLSPPAGPVLACGLLVGLVVVPSVAGLRSRRSDRLVAADRAALTTRVVHLFRGAAELAVSGTGAAARHDVATAADRLADRQRSAPALGATSAVLLTAGVTAACALAADDTTGGRITAIVLTLVVLAAFDVCVPLPAVARQLARIAGAVRRIWPTRRYSCWTNSPRAWTPRRPMPCSPTSSRPPRGTPSYW
jgi:ABC-type transport system involved in cytochrome bd biosynthesis fused ATPase/permease subunit